MFSEDFKLDEEEFNELIERIKTPDPTVCTVEEKEEIIATLEQQAKKSKNIIEIV